MQEVKYGDQVVNPKALLNLYLACKLYASDMAYGVISMRTHEKVKEALRLAEEDYEAK